MSREEQKKEFKKSGRCAQPDRDVPELLCGYPLPCPWHTVIIDMGETPPSIKIPATNKKAMRPKVLKTLKNIAQALERAEEEG